ncbi:hypothetical protein M878_25715 [Streptomyces roseochromogenus subsp. oscitans DS 12.976]|uniref:Uncharacterized protein n=1 Tax=Streptomyces roseochromogenus subsp. oscitans DS 12.976 TaxID=1352936 RepID=V6K5R7_STRRC|nr:hypothetical protein M878_25715 [Streptomyces roseochromogenus subsp. oscitans DS 12.976]
MAAGSLWAPGSASFDWPRWFTRFADRLDALISTHLQDRYQLTLGYDDQ